MACPLSLRGDITGEEEHVMKYIVEHSGFNRQQRRRLEKLLKQAKARAKKAKRA